MNANRLTTPKEKVQQLQEKLGHVAKKNSKRKFHALYDKVYRWDVLCEAWRRVKANKGAAGVDAMTLADVEEQGEMNFLKDCERALKEGNYHPQPVRRHYIPKKDGKPRPLGIPSVRDRVIQMATKLVIEPIFEADFEDVSFGFRPKRSAKGALERIRKACNRKGNWVVDVDIQGYFDNMNQEKLMKLVQMRINDRRILKLIRKWLQAGVMEEGNVRRSDLGTPQGGVISPLLANIYLNYFDRLWEKHGRGLGELTRYADDFVVVCKTKKDAEHAYELIRRIMERLELTLHPTKTRIVGLWIGDEGFDFLGMHHRKTKAETSQGKVYYTTQQWLTQQAEERIRGVIKERLSPPSMRSRSFAEHVKWLNPKIQGWRNYYYTSYSQKRLAKLDWYMLQRLTRWYAKKRQRRKWMGSVSEVKYIASQYGLKTLL
ncbi:MULTISPECIES: group II intron reverse transcriptase/maturase [Paenibacillus]|uniref:RNA-directed DNA polymerase n=1 Tax=Paenibacillus pabuli TaxID=1472 RepID=A0A855XJI4_9BACL|nr:MULTISPECIES: group II intron reverse transcriptase/maturase [Paenibacillus]PWW31586.1 group II intron reverse transcriptase/maturase [Paenibacillus pabuli]PXV97783.1 group II intron reverse transcriptase/maturase [Paenibacillus taichungensis]RAI83530.1 group II intron reverse transcriptase/maturase [Paenibacillus pabuli]